MGLTLHDEIVAAVARWSFIPHDAVRVESPEYLVLGLPSWWDEPLELRSFTPTRAMDVVLDEVVAGCVPTGRPHLLCWVRLEAPTGWEDLLLARGGVLAETLAVLGRALDARDLPDLAPADDVELRWALDAATLRDAMWLGTEVFGGAMPDETTLAAEFERERVKAASGGGGSVVAYREGRPVGTAGVTVERGDVRLWGGAVLPRARRRGVYRALLRERLRYGVAHGGTLALVKGRVESSAPILLRAGFEMVGEERSYQVPLSSDPISGPAASG
ncbi:GNAT family N-acetyltransferase [Nocardioides sp. R-C-SC26]|uniref:GNAT family N-acetyltransferase n=1 Tax=Nocardioides sp. R-C-SC26 TaxID=2870414 RepID=UPI001E459B5B|nr:GNAT family N-acetyltransferase [Nocardioides sp. R-C-SC26]